MTGYNGCTSLITCISLFSDEGNGVRYLIGLVHGWKCEGCVGTGSTHREIRLDPLSSTDLGNTSEISQKLKGMSQTIYVENYEKVLNSWSAMRPGWRGSRSSHQVHYRETFRAQATRALRHISSYISRNLPGSYVVSFRKPILEFKTYLTWVDART
jgi:hypothetical protein